MQQTAERTCATARAWRLQRAHSKQLGKGWGMASLRSTDLRPGKRLHAAFRRAGLAYGFGFRDGQAVLLALEPQRPREPPSACIRLAADVERQQVAVGWRELLQRALDARKASEC